MTIRKIPSAEMRWDASPLGCLTADERAKLNRGYDPARFGARALLRRIVAAAGIRGCKVEKMAINTEALVFPAVKRVLFAQDCPCRACEVARDLYVHGPKPKVRPLRRWVPARAPKLPPAPKERPYTYLPTSEEAAPYKARGFQVRRVVICESESLDQLAFDLVAFSGEPPFQAASKAA